MSLFELRQFVARAAEKFSSAIVWSSLASIGESSAIRLTVVVPFVGYIILYNDYIQKFLLVSLLHVNQIGEGQNQQQIITLERLNYLYFGLLFLGVASFLYAIFAPREVAKHPSFVDYIQYVLPAASPSSLKSSAFNIIYKMANNLTKEELSPFFSGINLQFPADLTARIHELVADIHNSIISNWEGGPDKSDDSVDEGIYTGSGYLQTDVLIERIAASGLKIYEFYRIEYGGRFPEYGKEILFIEHTYLNNSRFYARTSIFVFYLIGFGLLIFPSAQITIQILFHWFS